MLLKNYVKAIEKLAKDHGDKQVFYSIDDVGSAFKEVVCSPGVITIPVSDGEQKSVVSIN